MKYGSVCSGIEAATVAWHPLGWKPAFFSEIEKFPRALLNHHYPSVPCHGDFTTIKRNEYGTIDLLVGGTPCQSFSVAGLGKGLSDDRGNLSLEFIRLAQREKPRWILWENVPGVLSNDKGRAFGSILGGLAKCGYGFAYRVLDAQYFGVPQRRRRVFVVGYLGDWRPAAAVLFEREGLQGDITPSRETGQDLAHCLRGRANSSHREDSDNFIAPTLTSNGDSHSGFRDERGLVIKEWPAQVAPTLDAHYGDKMGLENQHIEGGVDCLLPVTAMCLNAGAMGRQDAESETLIATRGFPSPTIGWSEELTSHIELAGTIQRGGAGGRHDGVMQPDMQVRRLTPTECERLQGFPDGYTKINNKTADSARYKALGNSMAVPVMNWLGQRIQMVEDIIA